MYRSFYGLTLKPFQISSDPKFLWLGEKHQEALAVLKYGILDNRGFLLLTGDVGTGKTTLINALVNSLGPDTLVAHVPDPGLTVMDFFNYIASAFQMEEHFDTKGDFLVRFRQFLEKSFTGQKQVLLIIDEAQRLDTLLLEEIRLLSNIELQQSKLINIFFVGQDEFNDILSRRENRALRQRMTLNYHIDTLTEEETGYFIKHRLKVAGTEKKIFNATAISEIFAFSAGYPRLMNIICDHALLTGYVKGIKTIDGEMIAECAKELRLPRRQLQEPKPLAMPATLPQPVLLPHPAVPPALPDNRRRRTLLFFSSIVLILLAISIVFSYGNKALWESFQRGIDTLAPIVTGETGQPGKTLPMPGERASVSEKSVPAMEPASSVVVSRIKIPEPEKTIPPPDKPVVATITVEKTEAIPVEANRSTPFSPSSSAQMERSESPVVPTPKVPAPLPPDEKTLSTLQIDNHLIVRFGYNSNDLSSGSYDILDQLSAYLKKTPAATITINGYTDNMGSLGYNLSLSGFRANIVKNYLMGHGVHASRMTAAGLGAANPIESNDTPEGRNSNRRVEIKVRNP
ncbi:MAG: AAA family ATPase [Pseudomonadota bacterium]